jgi:hypothetical protein
VSASSRSGGAWGAARRASGRAAGAAASATRRGPGSRTAGSGRLLRCRVDGGSSSGTGAWLDGRSAEWDAAAAAAAVAAAAAGGGLSWTGTLPVSVAPASRGLSELTLPPQSEACHSLASALSARAHSAAAPAAAAPAAAATPAVKPAALPAPAAAARRWARAAGGKLLAGLRACVLPVTEVHDDAFHSTMVMMAAPPLVPVVFMMPLASTGRP